MFEFREIKNESEYNPLSVSKNMPFNQAWFFGEWQETMGRKAVRFEIKKNFENIGFFQAISYPLIFSKNFLYISHVLVLRNFSEVEGRSVSDFLKAFKDALTKIAKKENAAFIRFDIFLSASVDLTKYFRKTPVSAYHSSYFQPKFEWIINLWKPESEILGEMHPKTRYNIGLAKRKGVKVEIIRDNFKKYFDDFYEFMEETAKRDKFNLHPEIYYRNIFQTLNSGNAFLTIAKYNKNILAVNLILIFGHSAYFIFGGSSGKYKNTMFSYLAQWEAIIEAKKRGFEIYNFGAVDANRYEGISRFKKGFGGKVLEYSDSYDLVLKPFWYRLYNLKKKWL